jgi:hypothetical protein
LFATESIIGGNVRVTFENVGFGPCPVCGESGRVLDGTFEFIGNTINVLSAPEWSQERLRWLEQRIRAAQQGAVALEQILDEVVGEAADLQALITRLSGLGWKAAQILAVLLTIIMFMQSQATPPANEEAVNAATERIIREMQRRPLTSPNQRATPRTKPRPTNAKHKPHKTHGRNKRRKK